MIDQRLLKHFYGHWLHFNGYANLYLYGPEIDKLKVHTIYDAKLKLRWRLSVFEVNNIKLYSYGLLYDDHKRRPDHNGEWSSNPASINAVFGTNITDISYNGCTMAMSKDDIMKFMPDGVYWLEGEDYPNMNTDNGLVIDFNGNTYKNYNELRKTF